MERGFLAAQGLELEIQQLNYPQGWWSKKNGVKVPEKKEKQDGGVWKREINKLKTKQKNTPNKLGEIHLVMTPCRSH